MENQSSWYCVVEVNWLELSSSWMLKIYFGWKSGCVAWDSKDKLKDVVLDAFTDYWKLGQRMEDI